MKGKPERGGKLQVEFDYQDLFRFHPDREWFVNRRLERKREIEEFLRKKQAEAKREAAEKPREPGLAGANWKEEAG